MVMLMAWSMGAKADHTATLDLASIKVTGCTIDAETHVVTYTDNFKAAYWDLSDAMKSFTTATVTIENTATIDIRITLRYTPVGASETSDITATIAAGETTAVLDIPESGTLGTLRVGNWNKGAGTCKIVSAVLSGLRDKYQFGLEALPRSASNTSYDATTKTITFGADGTSAATTYQYRGWTIGNAYLNDYKTYVVEFEPVNYKVQLQIPYDNGSGKTQYASTTVEAGEKRGSVTMPTDATTITGFTVKNATNPNSAVSQTLTLKKAYLTTEEIAYFDMTKCTSTWDDGATSSYDASTYTISWTSNTRRGWYVNADTYNGYKTIVIEFQPAPVAMTGEIRYKATSDASVTSTTFTVPVGSTMLTLPVPETIYNISAIFLIPASACSLTLTDAYATNKEYENSKTITLSTTETTCGDSWASGYLKLEKEALGLAQAGDQLAVTVTAVSSTDGSPCVALQTGSFSNFDPAVSSYSLSGKTASEENPITATFTLTEAMLNTINGNTENVNSGLVVKGSGFTFNQVDLIHNIYKIKGQPATNLWSGEEVITWNDPSNYVTLPASTFALAKKDMKLRMSFKDLKLSAQGRLSSSAWKAVPDADSYESLKTDWGNYYEFTITDAMLAELQAHGVNITGVGYTLISVDIIDPDCEYDITADFDTNDIIAWETTDGTPNLTVTITNNEAYEITVPINIALMTDMFTDFNTYSANVTLAAGETKVKNVEFNDLTAGFYRMSANVAGNKLCTYYIGYNPTAIVSPDDSQPDFWTFWDTWKERLAEIPIDAELTPLEGQEGDARNVYEVKYKSVPETVGGDPVYIYGYYAEPKAEGTYPCIIHFHGTDKSGELTKPSATTTGWCEFRFSARGQTLDKAKNGSVKYRTDPEKESSVDFYAYRLGDNDEHYYRYVYLDTRRAVDFVFSQAKVNKSQVFAAGGSQGGCLTYVCAALSDGKIRAIAPSITGHADFVHTMEIVGWPTNVFNNWINAAVTAGTFADYAAGKAALLAHQSYFDTKNFAKWIYCPVITNFSLQDQTDGPHLNISPYNLLTNVAAADKEYSINQFKGHAAADNWGTTYMAFFQKYIDAGTPLTIDNPVTVTAAGYGTYYNSTATQLPTGMQAATIDAASGNTLTINWRYDGDDNEKNVIPGGTAVMLKSSAGDHTLTLLPANTDAAPAGNLLHGSDVATTTTGGDIYYKLTYGSAGSENADKLGWYWGADNGAAFSIGAHKAWLALSNGQQAPSFFLLDDEIPTSISESLAPAQSNGEEVVYTLHGQRVSHPAKGLYIVNGKKVVMK